MIPFSGARAQECSCDRAILVVIIVIDNVVRDGYDNA